MVRQMASHISLIIPSQLGAFRDLNLTILHDLATLQGKNSPPPSFNARKDDGIEGSQNIPLDILGISEVKCWTLESTPLPVVLFRCSDVFYECNLSNSGDAQRDIV